jgi:ABC-type antimicrobial peptide transport system permease subunit
MENVIRDLDPNVPVFDVHTLRRHLATANAGRGMAALLVGTFGMLALVLAVTGMYAVTSYRIGMRTKEFGIRVALGAQSGDLFLLVIRQGARLILAGALGGSVLAVIGGRLLQRYLYGVSPFDLVIWLGIAVLLSAVGFVTLSIPARRATRVLATVALKYQ